MPTDLEPCKAIERIVALGEHIANHEPDELVRDQDGVGASARVLELLPDGRQIEVQRLLGPAECPVEPVRLVDVRGQDLRLAQPPVHRAGEYHRVVAEDVRQRDRRAAEEAASEVVTLVPHGRLGHVIGRVAGVVILERELGGVG